MESKPTKCFKPDSVRCILIFKILQGSLIFFGTGVDCQVTLSTNPWVRPSALPWAYVWAYVWVSGGVYAIYIHTELVAFQVDDKEGEEFTWPSPCAGMVWTVMYVFLKLFLLFFLSN